MKERELSQKETKSKVEKMLATGEPIFFATNGSHGHPNIRAMLPVKVEEANTLWFITDLESSKIIELVKSDKAAVYGYARNMAEFRLWGNVTILDDPATRKHLWRDEFKKYFVEGEDDPRLRILRFDVISGMYSKDEKSGIFTN